MTVVASEWHRITQRGIVCKRRCSAVFLLCCRSIRFSFVLLLTFDHFAHWRIDDAELCIKAIKRFQSKQLSLRKYFTSIWLYPVFLPNVIRWIQDPALELCRSFFFVGLVMDDVQGTQRLYKNLTHEKWKTNGNVIGLSLSPCQNGIQTNPNLIPDFMLRVHIKGKCKSRPIATCAELSPR